MRIDLHLHTTAYSSCSRMTPDRLMEAALKQGLDGVCITEHQHLWREDDARALSDRYGLAVFRGIEVTTTGGDVLVYGMDEEPGRLMSPAMLKKKVDAQGAIAIAAHPFRGFLVFGFGTLEMDLASAMDNPTFSHVHGLEVCNGLVTEDENEMAKSVAEAMGLIMVGGSDAHMDIGVGTCVTVFQDRIEDERGLVDAIRSGRYTVERRK